MPRPAQVLGLVGTNGIGKSTALKVLKGNLKPNLGQHDSPPTWEDILKHFRGSELQNYFQRVLEEKLKALIKPQYVDHIPKAAKGTVGPLLRAKDERKLVETMLVELQLDHVQTRDLEMLSGGELQRFAIAMVAVQEADVYMFDEPSSYLDVRQRLKAANVIRSLTGRVDAVDDDGEKLEASSSSSEAKFVIVVEHDLAVLDYLSDFSASRARGAA
jgi:ATP-binding cassette subfamily E protein 1